MILSIIVPVYNAAPWLGRCLDSRLDQGLDGDAYEILLIDDGSTDASPDICRQYAAAHSGIQVFRQENSGQWTARNRGLERARGEWIAFVDADDCLVSRGLARILTYCDDRIEGVRFHSSLLQEEAVRSIPDGSGQDLPGTVFSGGGQEFIKRFGLDFFCWSWIYRKRFLDEHGLRFPARQGEDLFFLYRFLTEDPEVVVVPLDIYRYFVHPDSVTTRDAKEYCRSWSDDMLQVLSDIRADAESRREADPELCAGCLDAVAAKMPMVFSRLLKSDYSREEYKAVAARIRENRLILPGGKGTRPAARLARAASCALVRFPGLYGPAKVFYKRVFRPWIYPRINRNR